MQLIYLEQWSENSLFCFSAGRYREYGQQQTKIMRQSFVIRNNLMQVGSNVEMVTSNMENCINLCEEIFASKETAKIVHVYAAKM